MTGGDRGLLLHARKPPQLFLNPTWDETFVDRALGLALDGTKPDTLQAALRAYYPHAVVRPRELAGEYESWYVYRDGHWIPANDGVGA
jgi:hypothetical protein